VKFGGLFHTTVVINRTRKIGMRKHMCYCSFFRHSTCRLVWLAVAAGSCRNVYFKPRLPMHDQQ